MVEISVPDWAQEAFLKLQLEKETTITIRETLTLGKSGAYVSICDATGKIDGVFILKITKLPSGKWASESEKHDQALALSGIKDMIPEIIARTTCNGFQALPTTSLNLLIIYILPISLYG